MTSKVCRKCRVIKYLDGFYKAKSNKSGFTSSCKVCCGILSKEYVSKHKEKTAAYRTKYHFEHKQKFNERSRKYAKDNSELLYRRVMFKRYGITSDQLDSLLMKQNHVCAICFGKDAKKRLAVDHCHTTGPVRSLLCGECNMGLGKFKDSSNILFRAAEYLKGFGK